MRWAGLRGRRTPHHVQQANGLMERITAVQLPRSAGSWRIAMMGPKGGSGKTPTAATLGLNLAGLRGEITAVVDANTHPGTLRRRLVPEGVEAPLSMLAMATIAATGQLAPEWPVLASYSDLVGRLRVFANTGVDPALVEDITGQRYSDFLALLTRAAQLAISDMGTSTAGEVAVAALDAADQLVLCTELRRDALEMALEWLSALYGQPVSYRPNPEDYSGIADGRYAELASRAIIAVAPGGGDPAALRPLLDWFAAATNAGRPGGRVVVVPHDPHIARGEQILLEQLQPATRLAYLQIAGHVVDNFPLGRLGTRRLPPAPGALPQLAVQTGPVVAIAGTAPAEPATASWPPPLRRPEPSPPASTAIRPAPPAAGLGLPVGRGEADLAGAAAAALQPRTRPEPSTAAAVDPAAVAPTRLRAVPAGPGAGVGEAANLALRRELAGVLGAEHTEGEVCTGCTVRGCSWPVPPPAGAGQRL
jgi:MinD-like ATPase involved in chromosome partitioning or flagellar assembly